MTLVQCFNFSLSGSFNINMTQKVKSSNTQLDYEFVWMNCQQPRKYGDNWKIIKKINKCPSRL